MVTGYVHGRWLYRMAMCLWQTVGDDSYVHVRWFMSMMVGGDYVHGRWLEKRMVPMVTDYVQGRWLEKRMVLMVAG